MAMTTCEEYDFTLEVPEIDCALLMELLEEPNGEGGGFVDENSEGSMLDDILSGFDGHDCTKSSMVDVMDIEEPLDWEAMEMVASHDMGGWYMDEEGVFGYEEQILYHGDCFHLNGESLVEQVYIPLWQ